MEGFDKSPVGPATEPPVRPSAGSHLLHLIFGSVMATAGILMLGAALNPTSAAASEQPSDGPTILGGLDSVIDHALSEIELLGAPLPAELHDISLQDTISQVAGPLVTIIDSVVEDIPVADRLTDRFADRLLGIDPAIPVAVPGSAVMGIAVSGIAAPSSMPSPSANAAFEPASPSGTPDRAPDSPAGLPLAATPPSPVTTSGTASSNGGASGGAAASADLTLVPYLPRPIASVGGIGDDDIAPSSPTSDHDSTPD